MLETRAAYLIRPRRFTSVHGMMDIAVHSIALSLNTRDGARGITHFKVNRRYIKHLVVSNYFYTARAKPQETSAM